MKLLKNTKGSSVLEIIIAMGIIVLITPSIVILYLATGSSNLREKENLQAQMYFLQGYEALVSIRDSNYSNLSNGNHGLSKNNGYWGLNGSTDTSGKYTRQITIEDVYRDASCALDPTGIHDPNTKKAQISVSWTSFNNIEQNLSAIAYLRNKTDFSGCGAAGIDDLTINSDSAYLDLDNKVIAGISIENTHSSADLTIDLITVSWTGGTNGSKIEEIVIDTQTVWSGTKSSGTTLDISDITLTSGSGAHQINQLIFKKDMSGANLSLTFTLSTGESKTVSNIQF
ncbi:hypothetical protein GF354_02795 [Candidatus Peregrinibacteria bacterium]|nr:hypothetical protein [Candidatus Peregrinibacteria bacterium]